MPLLKTSHGSTMPEEDTEAINSRRRSKQVQDEEDDELDEEETARLEARRLRAAIAEATDAREELQQKNAKKVVAVTGGNNHAPDANLLSCFVLTDSSGALQLIFRKPKRVAPLLELQEATH